MKKRMIYLGLSVSMLLGIMLTGCGNSKNTFASVTDSELFKTVPIMSGEKLEFSSVEDVGDGNFMITATDTTMKEYEDYLTLLEEKGFSKHVDNRDGLEGHIYTSHYQKKDLLVVVSYFSKLKNTTITVCEKETLSEQLVYNNKFVADNLSGAKTKFIMPELYTAGNSFIIQLKNGHFIINDGGMAEDLPYLLDYLDSLVEPGEKPIVDAWIISHAHKDHMGVFIGVFENQVYANRLYVEEVYFTKPSDDAQVADAGAYDKADVLCFYTETVPAMFKTTEGTETPVYRMRPGERYYFNDITMDIMFTPDMLPYAEWKTWNATSVVLMYTIEGQKVMIGADTDWECQKVMLEVFNDEYFDTAIYQAPHHGGNVYNEFSSHIKTDTVLYPTNDGVRDTVKTSMLGRWVQNTYLKSIADEALDWGNGGIVLTFPYEVGSYEVLPRTQWIYNENESEFME